MAARSPIVVFGAGGFGREIVVLLRDIERTDPGRWELIGFVDDAVPNLDLCNALGVTYLGDRTDAKTKVPEGTHFVAAIGSGQARKSVSEGLVAMGWDPATLVHPSAWIGDCVTLGAGSVVCAGSILTTNITFGPGAQINLSCTVGARRRGWRIRDSLASRKPLRRGHARGSGDRLHAGLPSTPASQSGRRQLLEQELSSRRTFRPARRWSEYPRSR